MASLGPAVTSLKSSLSLLDSSISILDQGVSDFPRLCKVLQTQQHFELLAEPTLREAQQSLVDEIVPAIQQLVSTAERHVHQLERKEASLQARSELLEGRLNNDRRSSSLGGNTLPFRNLKSTTSTGPSLSDTKTLEMKRLQQKKERLQYAIDRLELQSKQRERELRKSMAFVGE